MDYMPRLELFFKPPGNSHHHHLHNHRICNLPFSSRMAVLSKRKRPSQEHGGRKPQRTSGVAGTSLPLRSRKVRFGSEDAEPINIEQLPPNPLADIPKNQAHSESEDEDEAPETVTTTQAAVESKSLLAGVTRAIAFQNEAARRKRRDRDTRLKEQSQEKRKTRQKKPQGSKVGGNSLSTEDEDVSMDDDDDDGALPDFLPESFLAEISEERPPTPPLEEMDIEPAVSTRLKHTFKGEFKLPARKGPQDLELGNTKVSILEEHNHRLPPEATPKTKAIRDTWMKGRPTMNGRRKPRQMRGSRVERKPFGKINVRFNRGRLVR
jgi:hypothetical protein